MKPKISFLENTVKRTFDFVVAFVGLFFCSWIIIFAFLIATIDTKSNGFFTQQRVGKGGKLFHLIKIKTMRKVDGINTTITKSSDARITKAGAFFRVTKIDELPQLFNVLTGKMSFVGPRPDVSGFADKLKGKDRSILSLRPGITGPATLVFRDEEDIFEDKENPEKFNREVIFPKKVELNLKYLENYSFGKDIKYILATIVPSLFPNIKEEILSE